MPDTAGALIPVVWAGTNWNAGDNPVDGSCSVVTDVAGWYGTPGLNGNDVALALTDGVLRGTKLLAQREVTLSGVITGPRAPVVGYARQLGGLAAQRAEVPLQVGVYDETGAGQLLTAQVRADTSQLTVAWLNRYSFQWQAVLTAADPLLYDAQVQNATLTVPSTATGRVYPRRFGWHYAGLASNSVAMLNAGNVPAPVLLTFTGPLGSTPQITDGTNSISLQNLGAGEVVYVESDTLAAWAPGGATRASYVQQGSAPMLVPTGTTVWSLYATGTGNVALAWQSAWA
jgi:hypothetical protein